MKTALRVGWLYTGKGPLITDALITWEDQKLTSIGKYAENLIEGDVEIHHYPHSLCVPAFINAHTHIPETLIRGLADDFPLETWLYDHVWKVEPQMKAKDAYVGAQLGMAEMISTGTIGFIDQFYYADQIAEATSTSGMKAYLHPSIFDNNPENGTIKASFEENLRVFDKWHGFDERIQVGFGPHALYSVSEEEFLEIYHEANIRDTWIHTHVLETRQERNNALRDWNMSTVYKLEEMGTLNRVLSAHGVHMNEDDLKLISKHNVPILHNLGSNLKLGSGIANVPKMLEYDIPVVIGTDGNASNNDLAVLEEIRLVALVHKGINENATIIPTSTALQMATSNNHRIFKEFYTGQIVVGHPADLAVFNMDTIRSRPIRDPLSNLVYSISPTDCQFTVCNGKILFQDGIFTTLEIDSLKSEAQKISDRMLEDADYP